MLISFQNDHRLTVENECRDAVCCSAATGCTGCSSSPQNETGGYILVGQDVTVIVNYTMGTRLSVEDKRIVGLCNCPCHSRTLSLPTRVQSVRDALRNSSERAETPIQPLAVHGRMIHCPFIATARTITSWHGSLRQMSRRINEAHFSTKPCTSSRGMAPVFVSALRVIFFCQEYILNNGPGSDLFSETKKSST